MNQILPIGSVVEAHDARLCLLGARMMEWEGKMTLAYYAVRHPRGYAGPESLGAVPAKDIERVLFTGKCGASGRQFIEGLTQLYGEMEGKSQAEAMELLNSARAELCK